MAGTKGSENEAQSPKGSVPARADSRRLTIQRAALQQFSTRGIAGTSMANIAEAAGVSRPLLYQYYSDKTDIFASAFVAMFDEHVDRALAALEQSGAATRRFDDLLQRYEGDLWERMSASRHIDEIIAAKNEQISMAVHEVVDRLWAGVAQHLDEVVPGRSKHAVALRADCLDLLRMSPPGLRADRPSVERFRRRLSGLATAVAAMIECN